MRNVFRKSKSVVTEATQGLKSLDQFSEHFVMKLSDQENRVSSCMGCCLTLIITVFVALFLYAKAKAWEATDQVDIMSAFTENAFTYEETFDNSRGLHIAAGLTEYNSNTTMLEEPRYGELIIEHYGWGYEGELGSQSKSLNWHLCSEEELGLKPGADSVVYPLHESQIEEVTTYKNKFKCLDKEDLVIWGDYNSRKAQQIAVKFQMCQGHDYCEDEATIRKWLAGKFIILVSNRIIFNQDEYHERASLAESRLLYIPVSSQVRQIYPYKVSLTHLELQDYNSIMLDSWTLEMNTDLFKLTKQDLQPYEKDDNTWVSVTFEMDLGLMLYEREVYTLFELLSDVGGLSGILVSICALLTTAWNYNNFDNFMVSNLFKIQSDQSDKEGGGKREIIRPSRFPYCKELLHSLLCHCCTERGCKRSRHAQAMHLARKRLAKETNIIEIVRSRRLIKQVTELLVPADKIKEMKAECQYLTVDPDTTDSDSMMKSEKSERQDATDSRALDRPIHGPSGLRERSSESMPKAKGRVAAPKDFEQKLPRRGGQVAGIEIGPVTESRIGVLETISHEVDHGLNLGTVDPDGHRSQDTQEQARTAGDYRLPKINRKRGQIVKVYDMSAMGKTEAYDTNRPLTEF